MIRVATIVWSLVIVVCTANIVAYALAQPPTTAPIVVTSPEVTVVTSRPVADPGTIYWYLGSVTGIVACTLVGVQICKRLFRDVVIIQNTPLWVLSIIIAAGLSIVARYVLHSIEGDGVALVFQAVFNAAAAGGFWSWMQSPVTTPASVGKAEDKLLREAARGRG